MKDYVHCRKFIFYAQMAISLHTPACTQQLWLHTHSFLKYLLKNFLEWMNNEWGIFLQFWYNVYVHVRNKQD